METDFYSSLTEEVTLEGLDGITLDTLWIRLKDRPQFSLKVEDQSKQFLWKCLVSQEEFEFYELPVERSTIISFNRFHYVDPESGQLIDVEENNEEIYPIKVIDDKGVVGSCMTYETRKKITDDIRDTDRRAKCSFKEAVKRWGNKLVIVASQRLRNEALFGADYDPSLEWSPDVYCILERIGRSRYHGEVSTGYNSLGAFKMDPKTMFYRTLLLVRAGIIKKQSVAVVDCKRKMQQLRRVFHLTRFFKEISCKYTILLKQVCEYLEKKPLQKEVLSTTRSDNHIDEKSMKKLMKYKPALNCLKINVVPYRTLYPDATEKVYLTKSKQKEKLLRIVELIRMPTGEDYDDDPVTNMEDDEEEEVEDTGEDNGESVSYKMIYERPLLHQGLKAVELTGPEGTSLPKLMKIMNISYLEARSILKYLDKLKVVEKIVVDAGKNKTHIYVANSFYKQSKYHKEYLEHEEKLKSLMDKGESKQEDKEDTWGKLYDNKNTDDQPSVSTEEKKDEKIEPVVDDTVSFVMTYMDDAAQEAENAKTDEKEEKLNKGGRKQKEKLGVTGRHLKRMHMILEAVRQNRLIDNTYCLVRLLREKEKEEGVITKVDKKTIHRLIAQLVRERKIRSIKTIVTVGNEQKTLHFLCDRSVEPTDPVIKSTIEQIKMKLFTFSKDVMKSVKTEQEREERQTPKVQRIPTNIPESARESIKKLQEFKSLLKPKDMIYDANACFEYGFKPKMQRLKIVHAYLWYLVYGHAGNGPIKPAEPVADISSPFGIIKEPDVYKDVSSWIRYIPPLPEHKGFPKGWCLLSDVLLYLPLRIFCSVIRITYQIEGLKDALKNPSLGLYPVCYLPFKLTQQLMFARKYIYSVAECCQRLCLIGLLSFGHQVIKEKDQVFVYLHKIGSLVDTRLSLPGYCKITMPKGHEPEVITYKFDSQENVDKYWTDLHYFAFNSNMGHRNEHDEASQTYDIFLSLEDALSPRTIDTVIDDGMIPGDRRGAGGLDSSMFVHLVRNWAWSLVTRNKTKGVNEGDEIFDVPQRSTPTLLQPMLKVGSGKRLPRTLPHDRLTLMGEKSDKLIVKVSTTKNTKGNKGGKGIKRKRDTEEKTVIPKKKVLRVMPPRKKIIPTIKRKDLIDAIDIKASMRKISQRVQWSSIEDSILLTCKIAQLVMNKSARGLVVPWTVVRDVLYEHAPQESIDKTSHACQRRVSFSLKNSVTRNNLSMFLSEVMQDQEIVKSYSGKKYLQSSPFTIDKFKKLVAILLKKFALSGVKSCVSLPDSVSDLQNYTVTAFNHSVSLGFSEITDKASILEGVLHNIFHSYVSLSDKSGRAYEMFKLLNQYPDLLLTTVIRKMKTASLIVKIKKDKDKAPLESGIHNVKLSQKYSYKFKSRYPESIFEESAECFGKLRDNLSDSSDSMLSFLEIPKGGFCANIIDLNFLRKLTINTIIPKDIIILDPTENFVGRGDPTVKTFQQMVQKDYDKEEDMETEQLTGEDDLADEEAEDDDTKGSSSRRPPPAHIEHSYGQQSSNYWTGISSKKSKFEFESDRTSKSWKNVKSTYASRAMITMRRQQQENYSLKHYNVQDNFVINACCVKMALLDTEVPDHTELSHETDMEIDASKSSYQQTELKADIPRTSGQQTDLEADVPKTSGQQTDLEADVPRTSSQQTDLEADIPRTSSQQTDLEADVPRTSGQQTDMGAHVPRTSSHQSERKVADDNSELMLSEETIKSVKQKIQRYLPFCVDMDEVWTTFTNEDVDVGKLIYSFIDSYKENGVTVFDLKKEFRRIKRFKDIIKCLEDSVAIIHQ